MVISLIFSKLEVLNCKIHIMITESKVTEIFCVAEDFCKEFEEEMAKKLLLPLRVHSSDVEKA